MDEEFNVDTKESIENLNEDEEVLMDPDEASSISLDDNDDDTDDETKDISNQNDEDSEGVISDISDSDSDESENDNQKLLNYKEENYLQQMHSELLSYNNDEVQNLTTIVRNSDGIIIDLLHKTIPFLTKYEKAKVLGIRAKQLNDGAVSFIKVPSNIIDGYLIAELELEQKKIPFIIKRPIPGGGCEFWNLKDLDIIHF